MACGYDYYEVYSRPDWQPMYDYNNPLCQGSETSCPLDGLNPALYYYLMIRKSNLICGNESVHSEEILYRPDTDLDGIPDRIENSSCSSSTMPDTDGDQLPDGVEDTNHNGMQDFNETSACSSDSDQDMYNDYYEVIAGSDPLDDRSTPTIVCTDSASVCTDCDLAIMQCMPGINSAIIFGRNHAESGTTALIKIGSGSYIENEYTINGPAMVIMRNGSVILE